MIFNAETAINRHHLIVRSAAAAPDSREEVAPSHPREEEGGRARGDRGERRHPGRARGGPDHAPDPLIAVVVEEGEGLTRRDS